MAYSVQVEERYEIHLFNFADASDRRIVRLEDADSLAPRWDGDNLMFVAQRNEGREIMIWNAVNEEIVSLAGQGFTPWATSPAPNPNRASILFENPTSIGTEIREWTPEGVAVRIGASGNAALPQWLEDGRRWAYLSSGAGSGQQLHLWDDGATSQLTGEAPIIGGFGVGQGDRLYYGSGTNALYSIGAEGDREEWLLADSVFDVAAAPDRPLLVLSMNASPASSGLHAWRLDGSAPASLPLPCCHAGQAALQRLAP